MNADADLDQDKACDYIARASSTDIRSPPSAEWAVHCGQDWKTMPLKFEAPYVVVSSGTCEDAGKKSIVDAETCNAAASFLGMTDTSAESPSGDSGLGGCFWDSARQSLHISADVGSAGNDAETSKKLICATARSTIEGQT